jgi:hypothetical protein
MYRINSTEHLDHDQNQRVRSCMHETLRLQIYPSDLQW